MSKDYELLRLAAKAAGERVEFTDGRSVPFIDGDVACPAWNPLDDDGTALRLAVKLGIVIDTGDGVHVQYVIDCIAWPISEWDFTDIYAATRRAIVRAAAEIGRQMEEGGAA